MILTGAQNLGALLVSAGVLLLIGTGVRFTLGGSEYDEIKAASSEHSGGIQEGGEDES